MANGKQILFGLHSVETLLQKQPERVGRLAILQERRDRKMDKILQLAEQYNIPVEFYPRKDLDRMTKEANHQGVVAFCGAAVTYGENDLAELLEKTTTPLILVLDGVQDPHNLGACFRSADAAGVNVIIAPRDKSVGITPVVTKVASGAAESVPFVQVTNLVRALEKLKELGVWIYGAAGESEQVLYEVDMKGPTALVLGAEGAGLRRLTREHCDALIKIPMFGSVESLNVSVAAGIMLFEAVRQRHEEMDYTS